MRAPLFWGSRLSVLSLALSPLGCLTAYATSRRVCREGLRLNIPVICVGNINAGGTGKTPTVMAVVQRLQALGHAPHIVSRGHGGRLIGPVRVDARVHDASAVGDEPLLLSSFAPVWVSKDRAAGGVAACAAGADVIVLDDGHQNPALVKDLSIVVVDAGRGFGNGLCLPAGPLREPVSAGLSRADLVVSIGEAAAQERFASRWGAYLPCPHFTGQLAPLPTGMDWRGLRCLAFAGIGYPEKFFDTLRGLGASVVRTESLGDHQPFTAALLSRLWHDAQADGLQLVTTEKDAARLPSSLRGEVLTLPVRLEILQAEALDARLHSLF
ncbi:tetraacyldisaccharide 4'-kinase [Thioclava sp. 'Guangxiensis']|uniref:tetraacyldisaccharide 4'-kinase n=1 Tax=Thioclava sp. 'Guangxiensis' TaxID=3149044 RepID=UPI003877D692